MLASIRSKVIAMIGHNRCHSHSHIPYPIATVCFAKALSIPAFPMLLLDGICRIRLRKFPQPQPQVWNCLRCNLFKTSVDLRAVLRTGSRYRTAMAKKVKAKANASTNQKLTVSADMQRLFGVAPSNEATVGTSAEEAVVATSASGNRSHGWPQRQPQLQPITFR